VGPCPASASLDLVSGVRTGSVFERIQMSSYSAIVLICLASVPQEDCNEKTALDVMSIKVSTELGCAMGWQEILARSGLQRDDLGAPTYPKTICRQNRQDNNSPPPG
jgi:hypothetical protein